MKRETTPWAYPLGAVVTWSGGAPNDQPYTIVARRFTEGQVSRFYEYLLLQTAHLVGVGVWAYEPDVSPVRQEAP